MTDGRTLLTASATSGPTRHRFGFQRRPTTTEMSLAQPHSLLGSNFRHIDFFYRPTTTCQSAERSAARCVPTRRPSCPSSGRPPAALERSGHRRPKNGTSQPLSRSSGSPSSPALLVNSQGTNLHAFQLSTRQCTAGRCPSQRRKKNSRLDVQLIRNYNKRRTVSSSSARETSKIVYQQQYSSDKKSKA